MTEVQMYVVLCEIAGTAFPVCVCTNERDGLLMAEAMQQRGVLDMVRPEMRGRLAGHRATFKAWPAPLANVGAEIDALLAAQRVRRAMNLE